MLDMLSVKGEAIINDIMSDMKQQLSDYELIDVVVKNPEYSDNYLFVVAAYNKKNQTYSVFSSYNHSMRSFYGGNYDIADYEDAMNIMYGFSSCETTGTDKINEAIDKIADFITCSTGGLVSQEDIDINEIRGNLNKIDIAHMIDEEDENFEILVSLNLTRNMFMRYQNGELTDINQFDTFSSLLEELDYLNFEQLVCS